MDVIDKRKQFVDNLKKDYPEMKVHFVNQTEKHMWESEKLLKNLTNDELEIFNLRKSRPNEIIFDVENENDVNLVKDRLQKRQLKYEMWHTGSRGYHFSVIFDNLQDFDLELRNRIRKHYIKDVGTDEALSRESQYVSLEYTPHFKTGKDKYLFDTWDTTPDMNHVPDDTIEYCQKDIERLKAPRISEADEDDREDFKDFLNDPYLKYVLSKKIIDGGRNDVLFKNLAIGLVKSGLLREEILRIGQAIVNNCPGKNINEFMGWADKALAGLLTDYNKAELNSWALKYEHPVYYKFEDINLDNLLTIEQLWDILWNYRLACQDEWKELCLYNLISTVIDEREDDLRVHVMFSCDSTAGKDEGLNITQKILDRLDYVTFRPSTATDKTLVGGVNQMQLEINTKNKNKGKEENNNSAIEKGILQRANWIGYGESETVFKPRAHNQDLHIILRQAMDSSRQVNKGVGGLMVDLNTNATFAFTTYPISNIVSQLMENGLFQRILYFHKLLTKEEHNKISRHIQRMRFDPLIKTNFDENKYINLLCQKLKELKGWYDENKFKLIANEDNYNHIDELRQAYEDYDLSVLNDDDKRIMFSMIRRHINTIFKITLISAIIDNKATFTIQHISKGFKLLKTCLNSVKEILLNVKKSDKHVIALLYTLKKQSLPTMTLHEILENNARMKSPNARSSLIKKCVDLEYITTYINDRATYHQLTEKGEEYLQTL
jgi:hypothetical protein